MSWVVNVVNSQATGKYWISQTMQRMTLLARRRRWWTVQKSDRSLTRWSLGCNKSRMSVTHAGARRRDIRWVWGMPSSGAVTGEALTSVTKPQVTNFIASESYSYLCVCFFGKYEECWYCFVVMFVSFIALTLLICEDGEFWSTEIFCIFCNLMFLVKVEHGQQDAPMKVKFTAEEHIMVSLLHTEFPVDVRVVVGAFRIPIFGHICSFWLCMGDGSFWLGTAWKIWSPNSKFGMYNYSASFSVARVAYNFWFVLCIMSI